MFHHRLRSAAAQHLSLYRQAGRYALKGFPEMTSCQATGAAGAANAIKSGLGLFRSLQRKMFFSMSVSNPTCPNSDEYRPMSGTICLALAVFMNKSERRPSWQLPFCPV